MRGGGKMPTRWRGRVGGLRRYLGNPLVDADYVSSPAWKGCAGWSFDRSRRERTVGGETE